jgi:hypothetical protein
VAGGWSGERPDQSVDQSAHLLDQVQICRKIPLRKVAESDRTQSDCETIGILEDEDDDEYPGKPWLFWVRHGHYRGLTYICQNSKSCKFLTASEILPVTMGSTRTTPQIRNLGLSCVHAFSLFTFYELATPVARERNPTAPHAATPKC